MTLRIGVLGATGGVGQAAVRALRDTRLWTREREVNLRLGARDADRLRRLADRLPQPPGETETETSAVDILDERSLRAFCDGCAVVLSCAGPSYLIGDRAARAALDAGADFVDASGYDPVHAQLSALDLAARGRTAVLSAGIYPGLSSLLPRWLATQGVGKPVRLVAHLGGLEAATLGSAADLVLSLDGGAAWGSSGIALAGWRNGGRAEHVLRVAEDAEVPFFPDRLTVQPFLSQEAERIALDLGLAEMDWFNVFAGTQMRTALGRLRGRAPSADPQLTEAAKEVMRASELDVGGRPPYYVMVFGLEGTEGARTVVLRTSDTFRVTGTVAALAVRAVLGGEVAPGAHYAESLDPGAVVDGVRALGTVTTLDIVESVPVSAGETEVGAL
jgi:hypothetical protein